MRTFCLGSRHANEHPDRESSHSGQWNRGEHLLLWTHFSAGRPVIGRRGSYVDSNGINQACLYDPVQNSWSPTALMNEGRWYPTAITLPDGSVLISSGSLFTGDGQIVINDVQQTWKNGAWNSIVNFIGLPLFPRMHIGPDGRVFMCGGNAQSFFLNPQNGGTWTAGRFAPRATVIMRHR
jgi:hypothetical protein